MCRLITASPANELAVDEVPLKHVHVKDVQIKRVCFDTVEFAVCTDFGLPLIEI